jgi:hypothetical protein
MSRPRSKKGWTRTRPAPRERTTPRSPYAGLPRTSHDERRLAQCAICGKPARGVALLETHEGRVHVECYVARRGGHALLDLPRDERNKVRICQVSDELLAQIIERHGAP